MNDFLEHLAEKKYRYYHSLHKGKPQAYTSEDSYDRIKTIAKYEELLAIISYLPLYEGGIVKNRFDELVENL